MIELGKVFDLIGRAFKDSASKFGWKTIIQGSLHNLPSPEKLNDYVEGEYFALIDLESITPEDTETAGLYKPIYNYLIYLCRMGKTGDITKIRNDLIDNFARSWYNFWGTKQNWEIQIMNILIRVPEIEDNYDVLAVQFSGTISHLTTKGGNPNE